MAKKQPASQLPLNHLEPDRFVFIKRVLMYWIYLMNRTYVALGPGRGPWSCFSAQASPMGNHRVLYFKQNDPVLKSYFTDSKGLQ